MRKNSRKEQEVRGTITKLEEVDASLVLAFRLELVSSLPDCRGLLAVIRVHVVMPGRRARARTSDLYCCVSLDIVHPASDAHPPVGGVWSRSERARQTFIAVYRWTSYTSPATHTRL